MALHPYQSLGHDAFWKRSVAGPAIQDVDPVGEAKFILARNHKVATAGSCFAQHIARHLRQCGFNYLVTESAHPLVPSHLAEHYNFGTFTARYGNVYTSRQMVQLLRRAYGLFVPHEDVWRRDDGALIDPFRPQIQPHGFSTMEEFDADRRQHFAAVRKAIESLDCFVFTLGLTECWRSQLDGAVFPVCPGVSGGTFDPNAHEFHNLTFNEVLADLHALWTFVHNINPNARMILTVSPVPLVATASGQNVLTATTYSKSLLRAAAGEFSSNLDDVAYFPSYEIITGSYSKGQYFAPDLRSVTEAGVSHVMRLFLKHYTDVTKVADSQIQASDNVLGAMDTTELVAVVCEEEALRKFE